MSLLNESKGFTTNPSSEGPLIEGHPNLLLLLLLQRPNPVRVLDFYGGPKTLNFINKTLNSSVSRSILTLVMFGVPLPSDRNQFE